MKNPENVARAQEILRAKFGHDCLYPFYFAATECEAFGGTHDVNLHGPPQAGTPPFGKIEDLLSHELPEPSEILGNPLRATEILAEAWGTEVPVVNTVLAPLSLAPLLFGMDNWINTIVTAPDSAREVVEYLMPYSVTYSNELFDRGATALAYFNPFISPLILTFQEYEHLSFDLDKEYFQKIKGPAILSLAGSRIGPILPFIAEIGAAGFLVSANDDLHKIKVEWGEKLNLLGNLNNVAMEGWTPENADAAVQKCCESAASGGGYILSDHDGDLPEFVSDDVLYQIKASVDHWGNYG
jgi:uroporphyrinogen decarboxylase